MPKVQFTIESELGPARAGILTLNGITLKTPVFMPVGTRATIKGIVLDMLRRPEYLGHLEDIQIILSNTFHLHLRPGEQLIHDAGGVQQFMNRPGLVLTDSGGFQVFSLGLNKMGDHMISKKGPLVSLREGGIKFRSPIDGSQHFLSPEDAVDIQSQLGSDIMMMLDICSPGGISDLVYKKHMDQTHRWAQRQFDYYQSKQDTIHGVLFPIVQGGTNIDLRQESIDFLSPFATDGIAVGGVSVGESRDKIKEIVEFCGPKLPIHVPRYLMGVGDIKTIDLAIRAGFDMFDCVMPTRLGRHGIMYSEDGYIRLRNAKYRNDHSLLRSEARNGLSRQYTKAYVHHLLRENEALGGILLSLHNIFYLHEYVTRLRETIMAGHE